MKRDEALAQLSRDHHQALSRALLLKRADDSNAREALAAMVEFFDTEGSLHFRVEEDVLIPGFVRESDADPRDGMIVRVLTDHVWIRARVEALRAQPDPSPEDLHELGERLDEHVRHEERVLFPAIEDALSRDQLARLGAAVEAAEQNG